MTSPTESFDTLLDEVLTKLENAVEYSVMRRIANRQTVSNRTVHARAKQAIKELVLSEIGDGEVHVSHVCPSDSIPCREFAARGAFRNELRARINGGITP